jgi:hypothetical protein
MFYNNSQQQLVTPTSIDTEPTPRNNIYENDGLQTNTALKSIDLWLVLDGWPWKDGIPSINKPQFVAIEDNSNTYLQNDDLWILVTIGEQKKRYPYAILNRHEIVNDTFFQDNHPIHIAVTFCPLCWSAIVFDRTIEWNTVLFGVSWKLYNSNLLMYDNHTESLRSQTLGEAVVWDALWQTLSIIWSNVISWEEVKKFHPWTKILSTNTWIRRNYSNAPYGSYTTNNELYFPIENSPDSRLPIKTPLYITNITKDVSIAFVITQLVQEWTWTLEVNGQLYTAEYSGWVYAITWPEGKQLPGYFEMWFSRANKNPRAKYVWGIE